MNGSQLINEKSSRMISIQAELASEDFKHSRHNSEIVAGVTTTISEQEYKAMCVRQVELRSEYNTLEKECKELELLIKQEQEESLNTGII